MTLGTTGAMPGRASATDGGGGVGAAAGALGKAEAAGGAAAAGAAGTGVAGGVSATGAAGAGAAGAAGGAGKAAAVVGASAEAAAAGSATGAAASSSSPLASDAPPSDCSDDAEPLAESAARRGGVAPVDAAPRGDAPAAPLVLRPEGTPGLRTEDLGNILWRNRTGATLSLARCLLPTAWRRSRHAPQRRRLRRRPVAVLTPPRPAPLSF